MRIFLLPLLCLLFSVPAWAGNGLITKQSAHDVATTIDRLEAALEEKGLTIFARVNHTAGAAKVDLQLRPTELLIFGNPKAGTPLMQSDQRVGIDLPQKALAWQDAEGNVWLTYNDPAYLARRHFITDRDELAGKIGGLLKALTDKATR
ncbi:MAG: DUF302 domain-containing protein [Gammaproteobacteria bacterium]|nr:DUF302 domain-containing protein [Gammaproteobacteria bacterium]